MKSLLWVIYKALAYTKLNWCRGEAVNGAQAEAPVAMPEAGADESGGGEPKKLTPAEKQAAEKERQAVKRAKNKAKKDRKEARKAAEAAANPPPGAFSAPATPNHMFD